MTTTLEMNKVLEFYGAIGLLMFAAAVLCFAAMGMTIAPVTGGWIPVAHMTFVAGVVGLGMFIFVMMFTEVGRCPGGLRND